MQIYWEATLSFNSKGEHYSDYLEVDDTELIINLLPLTERTLKDILIEGKSEYSVEDFDINFLIEKDSI
jgi:hypothetical protein